VVARRRAFVFIGNVRSGEGLHGRFMPMSKEDGRIACLPFKIGMN